MATKNRMSKTEMVDALASESGLEKKQVNAVLDALTNHHPTGPVVPVHAGASLAGNESSDAASTGSIE